MMNVDFADLGNAVLVSSEAVAAGLTTLGYIKVVLIVGTVGLMLKGILSAVDNYIYKKSVTVKA
jgi:hypothetical protein